MKLNRIITLCAMAATLAISTTSLLAQDNPAATDQGGPGGNQGGQRRMRQGGGPGGGNFDPAARQQQRLDRYQEQLGFTNATEWDAVKPFVQKVMDTQRDVFSGQMRAMFGGRNRGGNGGGPGGMGGQTSPEQEALQKALDDNAPTAQIKDLLAKYKKSQKDKQAKLEAAQSELKKYLPSTKQEAEAYLLGLVN
jgi:hypothetical protein